MFNIRMFAFLAEEERRDRAGDGLGRGDDAGEDRGADERERRAADADGFVVLREEVVAEGPPVRPHRGEERRPRRRAVARLDAHGRERRARGHVLYHCSREGALGNYLRSVPEALVLSVLLDRAFVLRCDMPTKSEGIHVAWPHILYLSLSIYLSLSL